MATLAPDYAHIAPWTCHDGPHRKGLSKSHGNKTHAASLLFFLRSIIIEHTIGDQKYYESS